MWKNDSHLKIDFKKQRINHYSTRTPTFEIFTPSFRFESHINFAKPHITKPEATEVTSFFLCFIISGILPQHYQILNAQFLFFLKAFLFVHSISFVYIREMIKTELNDVDFFVCVFKICSQFKECHSTI